MKRITRWLVEVFRLEPIADFLREHKVPPELGGRRGWFYVFGLATLTAFLAQVVTGIGLATTYVPTPAHANESLRFITSETTFGGLLRAMHYVGASAMVALTFLHMGRTYLTASYKHPREMNWITGVVLLVFVMLMALSGQLLRWDENGVWTVAVAASFAGRVPLIGAWLAEFILAGPTVSGATLSRFYALHTLALPVLIVLFVAYHLYVLVQNGVSEWPDVEHPVRRATYRAWYKHREETVGIRYFPNATWREIVFSCFVVFFIVGLALVVGPKGPVAEPDPTRLSATPMPDWFVRWYYALLYLKPAGLESFVMVYAPLLVLVGLILLPIVFGHGHRTLKRRPWAVAVVGFVLVGFGTLTVMGLNSPWTPAYDTRPLEAEVLGVDSGPVYEGARLFHAKGCQYCHQVLDRGGGYGPDLTEVALRVEPADITTRIVQGFGNMPGYRDALTQEELEALLVFLRALPEYKERRRP